MLYPHIKQPRDYADGRIGVDGGKHEVSSKRGLNGKSCGFTISNFSHHDDIRVLTENGTKSGSKRVPDIRKHLRLVHSSDVIFNRIFKRNHILVVAIELV